MIINTATSNIDSLKMTFDKPLSFIKIYSITIYLKESLLSSIPTNGVVPSVYYRLFHDKQVW